MCGSSAIQLQKFLEMCSAFPITQSLQESTRLSNAHSNAVLVTANPHLLECVAGHVGIIENLHRNVYIKTVATMRSKTC